MPWLPELHTEAETIWWFEHIVLPEQQVWVAEVDGEIAGFAAVQGNMLEHLYISPEMQGKGVGSVLLKKAIEIADSPLRLWTFQRNIAARAFYKHRGFTSIEFTDGADNEEREPDVLYQLAVDRPILFVDIDGVLNPFGGQCPPGFEEHALFPQDDEPIRVNSSHSAWLLELSHSFDLVWATGWNAADRETLRTVLTLPAFRGAASMPPVPFEPAEKVKGVKEIAGERPCAWIDDVITPEAKKWAAQRIQPTLLIHTNSHEGLQRNHVDQLIRWFSAVSHGGLTTT